MIESLLVNLKSTGVFVIVLSILIIVHEWGHFITAKRLGVRVEKFSLGFGPKLFSKFHDGTEFLICAIPLGGYVKMAGDERGRTTGRPDEFYTKSPGHRALIVLNGPVVNFILAYLCLVLVFIFGYPDLSTKVGKLVDDYPAQMAGLKEGDEITHINDQPIRIWTDLQKQITESKEGSLKITFNRDNQTQTLMIEPKEEEKKNVFGQTQKQRLVGIIPKEDDVITVRYGVGESFVLAYQKLAEITILTYKSLYFMITGSMSVKDSVTGPVGIFYIVKTASEMGITHLLLILGVISASLAIFNLLPVIPLDGGHLFLFAIEKIRGRSLSPKIDEYIARIGFALIICLALFVFYTDFARFGIFDKLHNLFNRG